MSVTTDAGDAEKVRDLLEEGLQRAIDRALQRFLGIVEAHVLASLPPDDPPGPSGALAAAASPAEHPGPPPALGDYLGWWTEVVDFDLMADIELEYQTVYAMPEAGATYDSALRHAPEYVAKVRDRLVRGIQPPIYEESFARVREALGQSAIDGWSRPQLAQRIAAELSWETDEPYWRRERDQLTRKMEAILDPLGPPGTPAREAARLHDAEIVRLRNERNEIVKRLEHDETYWKTRATRIARTEATGLAGYTSLMALHEEGWALKQWVSAHDDRTRESHVAADGQTVDLSVPFNVGGFDLMMPGDPAAPAGEVINCRCTIIGADPPEPVKTEEELALEAAEQALRDKWLGKPAPKPPKGAQPIEPKPGLPPAEEWDDWLTEVKQRFHDFHNGTKELESSYNWSTVQRVVNGSTPEDVMYALSQLKSMHYLDDGLHQRGVELVSRWETVPPELMADYRRRLRNWQAAQRRYKKRLAEWAEVNGRPADFYELRGLGYPPPELYSNREAVNQMNKTMPPPSATTETGSAVRHYTGGAYTEINPALWPHETYAPLPSTHRQHRQVKNMDQWFEDDARSGGGLKEDLFLHRGTNWGEFLLDGRREPNLNGRNPQNLVGTVHVQWGYFSSSVGENAAFGGAVQLVMMVPKGSPAAWVDPISLNKGEREMIMPRGTKVYIHQVVDRGHTHWVYGEVVPQSFTKYDGLHAPIEPPAGFPYPP